MMQFDTVMPFDGKPNNGQAVKVMADIEARLRRAYDPAVSRDERDLAWKATQKMCADNKVPIASFDKLIKELKAARDARKLEYIAAEENRRQESLAHLRAKIAARFKDEVMEDPYADMAQSDDVVAVAEQIVDASANDAHNEDFLNKMSAFANRVLELRDAGINVDVFVEGLLLRTASLSWDLDPEEVSV